MCGCVLIFCGEVWLKDILLVVFCDDRFFIFFCVVCGMFFGGFLFERF